MKRLVFFSLLFILFTSFGIVILKPVDDEDSISFTIKNFGINTNGSLRGLKGLIEWDSQELSVCLFRVSVDVNTIRTGVDARDHDLLKENYFDEEKYPLITFQSDRVVASSDGTLNVNGRLTIKGITKTITIPFTTIPSGNGYIFEGAFTIDRRDFNVGGNSFVLGNEVKVRLKVQANP